MRRVVVNEFLSLDGVMQGPGGPTEDESGGFTLGGWTVTYWDDTMNQFMDRTMGHPIDLLLGRRTYDIFAAYWPTAPEEAGGKPLNDATKYVASHTDVQLDWDRSQRIEGDVAEGVAAIKQGEGPDLVVFGSGELVRTLLGAGLVDEFRLMIFPVVLGTGKRLFAEGVKPGALKLVESAVSSTGVLMTVYEPAGEVVTGSL